MYIKAQKAFTVIELIYVIVIIGILSAIAVPKFTNTANLAYVSKGKTTLASVRNAIATERQKRILMGDTTPITDLCAGDSSYVFTKFNADSGGSGASREILRYPPKSGTSDGQWQKSGTNYTFYFHDGSTAKSCEFKLNNNKLKATSSCPELDN